MFTKKEIERYYDLSELHYRRFWGLDKSKSLHYGYWDSTTKNFHQALLNINKVLAQQIKIGPSDVVLDAGCGVGGSSVWLAKETGCKVIGITLSEKQVKQAKSLSVKEKVDHLVTFYQKDFTDTGFPGQTFDVVWAIESVCYVPDKSDFLKEAFRILKKEGRLIVADFFKKDGLNQNEDLQVKQWASGWAIDDYASKNSFEHALTSEGFSNIQFSNVTPAIMPSAKRLYRSYFLGMIPSFLYRMFHPGVTELAKNNVDAAYRQYKTLQKGLWMYGIVWANKII